MYTAVAVASPLRCRALTGHGLFSLGSGLAALVLAQSVARTPAAPSPLVLRPLEQVSTVHAGFLFWLAGRQTLRRRLDLVATLAALLDDRSVVSGGLLSLLAEMPVMAAGIELTSGGVR